MEIITLTPDVYKEWDDFCLKSDDAWFWHTTDWLKYDLKYRPEIKPKSKSFMIIDGDRILAICPLILVEIDGVKEFSYSGVHGPVPAFRNGLPKKEKNKVARLIFDHIDNLAKANNVKRTKLGFSVLSRAFLETEETAFNFPEKFGYLNNSLNAQVINLVKPLADLRKDISHGHNADINRAAKSLKAEIFDKSNITKEIFAAYVALHQRAAGRKTRPKATFDLMRGWIFQDKAFLLGAKAEGKFVGFSYFFVYKQNVFYGSSCNDPAFSDWPIAHFIQWNAIEWMNKRKYKFYEIGWQIYNEGMSDYSTKKRINISKFEKGFGGDTYPLFMGEKYYDKSFFIKIYNSRIKQFAETF